MAVYCVVFYFAASRDKSIMQGSYHLISCTSVGKRFFLSVDYLVNTATDKVGLYWRKYIVDGHLAIMIDAGFSCVFDFTSSKIGREISLRNHKQRLSKTITAFHTLHAISGQFLGCKLQLLLSRI